jgi:ribosomal protein L10
MTKRKKLLQLHQINKHLRGKKIVLFYQYNNVSTRDWGLLRGELLSEAAYCKLLPTSLLGEPDETYSFERGSANKASQASLASQGFGVPLDGFGVPLDGFGVPLDGFGASLNEFAISTLVVKSKIGQLSLRQALATNLEPASARSGTPIGPCIAKQCQSETERTAVGPSSKLYSYQGHNTKCAELFQGPTFLFACNSHRVMRMGYKVIGNKKDRWSNNHAILLGGLYHGKVVTHLDIAKLSVLDSSIYASLPIALENKVASLLVGGLSHQQNELLRCLECHRANLLRAPIGTPVRQGPEEGQA